MPNHRGIAFDPVLADTTTIPEYKERLDILIGTKIVFPARAMEIEQGCHEVYAEAVKCYLYGLPNASIVQTIRFFQLVSRAVFRQVEQKPTAKPNVEDLISWTARHLNEDISTRGFQILRNNVHTEVLIEDADALEGLRHISKIANKLAPFKVMRLQYQCNGCKNRHDGAVNTPDCFIGNRVSFSCPLNKFYVPTQLRINIA